MATSVSTVMNSNFYSIEAKSTVREASEEMARLKIGLVVILGENQTLAGVFSERDVMTRVVAKGLDPGKTTVGEVMTAKVVTVREDMEILEAWTEMKRRHFRHLLITNFDEQPVGILGARDILNFLSEKNAESQEFLDTISRIMGDSDGWAAT